MEGMSTIEAILDSENSGNIFLNGTLDIKKLMHEIQSSPGRLLGIGYCEIVNSCNDLFNNICSKWREKHGDSTTGMKEFFEFEASKLKANGDCEHAKALLLMFEYLCN